jgi:carbon monoxide dehydrogenase subunit G
VRLTHEFTVPAPVDRVWAFLMDVPAMAACIPGASDVRQVDDTSYDATVTAKIGPIAARFGCRIDVLELDEAAGTGTVEVGGKDVKLGGGVKARMAMTLQEADGVTKVTIVSDVDVLGRIGQYGHGMIGKRADAMLADFAACAGERLA